MDSDVCIALLKGGLSRVLGALGGVKFVITDTNYAEVSRGPQRCDLDAAIAGGGVEILRLEDPRMLEVFGQLLATLDEGEAATIALAVQLGAHVAMHDKAGRRAALARVSSDRVHRLEDIVADAVRSGCLTASDADDAAKKMGDAHDYRPAFASEGIAAALADPTLGLHRSKNPPSQQGGEHAGGP